MTGIALLIGQGTVGDAVDGVANGVANSLQGRSDNVFIIVVVILFFGFHYWIQSKKEIKEDERREKTDERHASALEANAQNGRNFSHSLDILASTTKAQADMTGKQITLMENFKELHLEFSEQVVATLKANNIMAREYRNALLQLIRYAKAHVTTDAESVRKALEMSEESLMRIRD